MSGPNLYPVIELLNKSIQSLTPILCLLWSVSSVVLHLVPEKYLGWLMNPPVCFSVTFKKYVGVEKVNLMTGYQLECTSLWPCYSTWFAGVHQQVYNNILWAYQRISVQVNKTCFSHLLIHSGMYYFCFLVKINSYTFWEISLHPCRELHEKISTTFILLNGQAMPRSVQRWNMVC